MNPAEVFVWWEGWPILGFAPLLWVVLTVLDARSARRTEKVLGPRAAEITERRGSWVGWWRRLLLCLGTAFALSALLKPAWGEAEAERRGIDLLLCLDVSRSMLATDESPTRLEHSRQQVRDLAERVRSGDRLGLIAFAGEARLSVPLTHDVATFADLVELTGPLSVRRGGTNLGAALTKALDSLQGQSGDHEVIVLITDGEDHEGKGWNVAQLCKDRQITVHCIGVGSELGSKIAIDGGGSFLVDRSGREVVSSLDLPSLRRIAEETGGTLMTTAASSGALLDLYDEQVLPMARKAFDTDSPERKQARFQWPLLIAFGLWILEASFAERRRR